MSTTKLLNERNKTHGSFVVNAAVSQLLKRLFRGQFTSDDYAELMNNVEYFQMGWDDLEPVHREAIDHMCGKFGRIYAGNPTFDDHWDDISGYGKLPVKFNHGKD